MIRALSEHHAAGRLTIAQLEQRVEALLAADTLEHAAAAALDGLPPLRSPGPRSQRARFGRGHAEADRPGPGWLATPERFRDPSSGRVMRVWVDAATGERHYVADRP